MNRPIIGNTTVTPYPRPDWNQTDERKADYIKNKPTKVSQLENDSGYLTETEVDEKISNSGGGGSSSITVDQAYNPESSNAQSGKAVAEAITGKADKSEITWVSDRVDMALTITKAPCQV